MDNVFIIMKQYIVAIRDRTRDIFWVIGMACVMIFGFRYLHAREAAGEPSETLDIVVTVLVGSCVIFFLPVCCYCSYRFLVQACTGRRVNPIGVNNEDDDYEMEDLESSTSQPEELVTPKTPEPVPPETPELPSIFTVPVRPDVPQLPSILFKEVFEKQKGLPTQEAPPLTIEDC